MSPLHIITSSTNCKMTVRSIPSSEYTVSENHPPPYIPDISETLTQYHCRSTHTCSSRPRNLFVGRSPDNFQVLPAIHFPSCLPFPHVVPVWPKSNKYTVSTHTPTSASHFEMRVVNTAASSQPSTSPSLSNIYHQRHDDDQILNCPRCGADIDIVLLQHRPEDPNGGCL